MKTREADRFAEDTAQIRTMHIGRYDCHRPALFCSAGLLPGSKREVGINQVMGTCKIVSYEPGKVVIEADAKNECYLVLTDSFYPGWKVVIDGQEGAIIQANILFRAVHLMKGKHDIVFIYRPKLFYIGLVISIGSLIGLITFFIIELKKKTSGKDLK